MGDELVKENNIFERVKNSASNTLKQAVDRFKEDPIQALAIPAEIVFAGALLSLDAVVVKNNIDMLNAGMEYFRQASGIDVPTKVMLLSSGSAFLAGITAGPIIIGQQLEGWWKGANKTSEVKNG